MGVGGGREKGREGERKRKKQINKKKRERKKKAFIHRLQVQPTMYVSQTRDLSHNRPTTEVKRLLPPLKPTPGPKETGRRLGDPWKNDGQLSQSHPSPVYDPASGQEERMGT